MPYSSMVVSSAGFGPMPHRLFIYIKKTACMVMSTPNIKVQRIKVRVYEDIGRVQGFLVAFKKGILLSIFQ